MLNSAIEGGDKMAEKCNKHLSAKQDAVALVLATGRSIREAAADCHVGERTIYRWQVELPAFPKRVRELRRSLFEQTSGRFAALQIKATEKLATFLDSPDEGMRYKAIKDIFLIGQRVREHDDLGAEIADLRRTVEEDRSHEPETPDCGSEEAAESQVSTQEKAGDESPRGAPGPIRGAQEAC
jgi:hypothetical protein